MEVFIETDSESESYTSSEEGRPLPSDRDRAETEEVGVVSEGEDVSEELPNEEAMDIPSPVVSSPSEGIRPPYT